MTELEFIIDAITKVVKDENERDMYISALRSITGIPSLSNKDILEAAYPDTFCPAGALIGLFVWGDTVMGRPFWANLYETLRYAQGGTTFLGGELST